MLRSLSTLDKYLCVLARGTISSSSYISNTSVHFLTSVRAGKNKSQLKYHTIKNYNLNLFRIYTTPK